MIRSMTGYAALETTHVIGDSHWTASWDLRGVNAKGLDLRIRMPDWVPGLEAAARLVISGGLGRGSVGVGLKLARADTGGTGLNAQALAEVIERVRDVTQAAAAAGVSLRMPTALDLLATRGVTETQDLSPPEAAALSKALQKDLPVLLHSFVAARQSEGAALGSVLGQQIDAIDSLIAQAGQTAIARGPFQSRALRDALARIEGASNIPEDRILQELAILATKSDITEELDRLAAHVASARDLLNDTKPVGRKLDFLCQEFNREANTLCSKSSDTDLTRIGLDLKTRIEQMREQVQNVE